MNFKISLPSLWLGAFVVCSGAYAFDGPLRPADLNSPSVLAGLGGGEGQRPADVLIYLLPGAKVVLADYELIKRDFPAVAKLSPPEIDAWLIREGAWMSGTQIALGGKAGIHGLIPYEQGKGRVALRPSGYGRALLLGVLAPNFLEPSQLGYPNGIGIFDAKGTGSFNPRKASHAHGLAALGEMIQEFAMEKLVHAVFTHSQLPYSTVESYAVLHLGFQFQDEHDVTHTAAIILRQAHVRASGSDGTVSIQFLHDRAGRSAMRTEKLLQSYGLTSSAVDYVSDMEKLAANGARSFVEAGILPWHGCNIQGFFGDPLQNALTVVDFGTYTVLDPLNFRYTDDYADLFGCQDQVVYQFPYSADPRLLVSVKNWGIEPRDREDLSKGFVDHLGDWASYWASQLSGPKAMSGKKAFAKRRAGLEAALLGRLGQEWASWAARARPVPAAVDPVLEPGAESEFKRARVGK